MKALMIEIYGRGGLTHYTYNLITELARREVEVTLLTSREYELADVLPTGGNGIHLDASFYRTSHRCRRYLPPLKHPRLRRWVKMLEYVLDTPRVALLCRRWRPDVVHLQGCNPILVITLAALKLMGCRAVYTAHDVPPLNNPWLARLLDRSIYRMADRVVVHSRADRDELRRRFDLAPQKIEVIHHGHYLFFRPDMVETREEARRRLELPPDDPMMLFFGFLSWYKGLDVLLRALPLVRREVPGVRLLAVGDAVKLGVGGLEEYRRLARELGVEDAFILKPGYVPMEKVPSYFTAADCVVMPYRVVSQSGVLHLAYAFGLPVVASRVGGFPESVKEGETGFLVPAEDPEALAVALGKLLGNEETRRRMGARAWEEAELSFSWEEAARRTSEVYGALLTDD